MIERVKPVLEVLESGEREGGARQRALIDDLPRFRFAPPPRPATPSAVEARLREALRLIYELRELL